jgi:signal peptidase I
MINKIKKAFDIFVAVLFVLIMGLTLLIVGSKICGMHLFTVLTGSMEPAYHTGSLILVQPTATSELQKDDVITYMVKNGALADRMYRALDGLQYNHIRNAYLLSVTQHHCVNIGNDRYMVDLTYVSNVDKYAGYYEETINLKVILLNTKDGLRAEAMLIY